MGILLPGWVGAGQVKNGLSYRGDEAWPELGCQVFQGQEAKVPFAKPRHTCPCREDDGSVREDRPIVGKSQCGYHEGRKEEEQ